MLTSFTELVVKTRAFPAARSNWSRISFPWLKIGLQWLAASVFNESFLSKVSLITLNTSSLVEIQTFSWTSNYIFTPWRYSGYAEFLKSFQILYSRSCISSSRSLKYPIYSSVPWLSATVKSTLQFLRNEATIRCYFRSTKVPHNHTRLWSYRIFSSWNYMME